MTTSPPPDRVTAIYDAIEAFQREHRTVGALQHAQIRALLAEHLDRALPAAPAVSSPPPDQTAGPVCKFDEGCHRVVPCEPGCGAPLPDQTLRDRLVAAIKASPFDELRTVDHAPNGPLLIKVKVDDLADTLMRRLPAVLPPPADRSAIRTNALLWAADLAEEVAKSLRGHHEFGRSTGALDVMTELRRLANEAQQPETDGAGEPAELRTLPREVRRLVHAVDRMRSDWAEAPEHGPERRELWTEVHSACDAVWDRLDTTGAEAQQQPDTETPADEVALLRLTLDAIEEGRRELRAENSRLRSQIWTLAAVFEGFGRLLASSSRDWGQYAADAWLYAVILGWDCEQPVHDETCTHGAMEEMAERHGWDAATVAKTRRYRAVVHTLTAPAVPVQPAAADTDPDPWHDDPKANTQEADLDRPQDRP